jgi:hypothetical protein
VLRVAFARTGENAMKKRLMIIGVSTILIGCLPGPTSITIEGPTSLQVNAQAQYTAIILPSNADQRVGWGVTCGSASCGTLPPSANMFLVGPVTYTAPATVPAGGTVTLTAISGAAISEKQASLTITITLPGASTLLVAGYPSPTTAGTANNFTVTAKDASGSTVAGYTGKVHFTSSSDPAAVLPADYTFTGSGTGKDNGTHTFSATLNTAGTRSITATDTATPSITGTQSGIQVNAAQAISVAIAPSSIAFVSTTETVRFVATTNDPVGVNWSVTCSVAACGSVFPTSTASGAATTYTAPPSPVASVTLTATSVQSPSVSASETFTIPSTSTNANNIQFRGQYAFLLNGFDSGGAMAIAGTFAANGAGGISRGMEDINSNTATFTGSAPLTGLTGIYNVRADRRGTMTLGNLTFQFALSNFIPGLNGPGAFGRARFIAYDKETNPTIRGSGVMEWQSFVTTSYDDSSIGGDFAFGASGTNQAFTSRVGFAGRFTAASTAGGTFNTGFLDQNFGGVTTAPQGFNGTYSIAPIGTSNNSSGRGTGHFLVSTETFNFAFYVVSKSSSTAGGEFFFVSTDPQSTFQLFSGQALQQTGTLPPSSFSGTSVFYTTGFVQTGSLFPARVKVGTLTFSVNNFTVSDDENAGGTVSCNITGVSGCFDSITGTYTVDATRLGRVTLSSAFPANVYLVSVDANGAKGFILGRSTPADTGFVEPQTGSPFSTMTLSGDFSFGSLTPEGGGIPDESGAATYQLATQIFTSDDEIFPLVVNIGLGPFSDPISSVSSSNGRVTFTSGTQVLWIVSRLKAVRIPLGPNPAVFIIEALF